MGASCAMERVAGGLSAERKKGFPWKHASRPGETQPPGPLVSPEEREEAQTHLSECAFGFCQAAAWEGKGGTGKMDGGGGGNNSPGSALSKTKWDLTWHKASRSLFF